MVDSILTENPSLEVIEFLKNIKLKSRASFLNILEYIPPKFGDYRMPVLMDLLVCLSPIGGQFHAYYIINPNTNQFRAIVDKDTANFKNDAYDME